MSRRTLSPTKGYVGRESYSSLMRFKKSWRRQQNLCKYNLIFLTKRETSTEQASTKGTGSRKHMLRAALKTELHPAREASKVACAASITCDKHGSVEVEVSGWACTAGVARDKLGGIDIDMFCFTDKAWIVEVDGLTCTGSIEMESQGNAQLSPPTAGKYKLLLARERMAAGDACSVIKLQSGSIISIGLKMIKIAYLEN